MNPSPRTRKQTAHLDRQAVAAYRAGVASLTLALGLCPIHSQELDACLPPCPFGIIGNEVDAPEVDDAHAEALWIERLDQPKPHDLTDWTSLAVIAQAARS